MRMEQWIPALDFLESGMHTGCVASTHVQLAVSPPILIRLSLGTNMVEPNESTCHLAGANRGS